MGGRKSKKLLTYKGGFEKKKGYMDEK